jgi:hypothetical protein
VCVCVCVFIYLKETRIKVARSGRMFLPYLQKKYKFRAAVEWLTAEAFLRSSNAF